MASHLKKGMNMLTVSFTGQNKHLFNSDKPKSLTLSSRILDVSIEHSKNGV